MEMKVCAPLQGNTCHIRRGLHQDILVQTPLLHEAGNLVRRNNVSTPQKELHDVRPTPLPNTLLNIDRKLTSEYPMPRHVVSIADTETIPPLRGLHSGRRGGMIWGQATVVGPAATPRFLDA